LEDVIDPPTISRAFPAQRHEMAFGIFEWFAKKRVFKGSEFFMSDIEKAITTMSAELNVILSGMNER